MWLLDGARMIGGKLFCWVNDLCCSLRLIVSEAASTATWYYVSLLRGVASAITTRAIIPRHVMASPRRHGHINVGEPPELGPGARGVDVKISPRWEESSLSWIFSITLPSSHPVGNLGERRWETTAKSWLRGPRASPERKRPTRRLKAVWTSDLHLRCILGIIPPNSESGMAKGAWEVFFWATLAGVGAQLSGSYSLAFS